MTIPTPGTNNFASAFNKDETSEGGGGGGDIFGSFCVENCFKKFSPFREKKSITNSRRSLKREMTTTKNRYAKLETLGEGTFGIVYKASDALNPTSYPFVAIKKIRLGKAKEGINFTAIERLNFSESCIIHTSFHLVDVFSKKRNLHLVFEFASGGDLEMIIKDSSIDLSIADVKSYLKMSLGAFMFCHQNWILHRDVKPNNLLVHSSGALKLADFGLARAFGSPERENGREYTCAGVCQMVSSTRTFVGAKRYGPEGRFVGGWDGIRGVDAKETVLRGKFRYRSVDEDLPCFRDADGGGVGRVRGAAGLDEFSLGKQKWI